MSNLQIRCPFCGSDNVRMVDFTYGQKSVRCEKCGAVGPRGDNATHARSLWVSAHAFLPQGADGLAVRPDDTVYVVRTGEQVCVDNLVYGGQDGWTAVTYNYGVYKPEELTHKRPTSWETLRSELEELILRSDIEDSTKESTAFMEKVRAFAEKGSDAQE